MDSQLWIAPALSLALGYLLGAIPFGLILTRLSGAGDLRTIGSGNIGATNVLRTGRKGLAALTLLLDMAKGLAAVLIAHALGEGLGPLGAVGAFFGHLYPVWLGFRGGKGVATLFGIAFAFSMLTVNPVFALVYAGVWLGALALLRISSAGGMLAAVALPVTALVIEQIELFMPFTAFALMVLWKHRSNIARLVAGTEPKVGTPANG